MRSHDPALRSWIASANDPATDFPVQNLPFGVFRHDFEERPRVGIAIGDQVLDCLAAARAGLFCELGPLVDDALQSWSLNALLSLGRADARAVRRAASRLLRRDTPEGKRAQALRDTIIVGNGSHRHAVPAEIGDYSDFYASIFHATNVGSDVRPDSPLLPNYKYVPIGYHGRASSIVVERHAGAPSARTDEAGCERAAGVRTVEMSRLRTGGWRVVCGENAIGETVPDLARGGARCSDFAC